MERSTTMFFKESRTGLIHQTNTRMTLNPATISGVFLGIMFIVGQTLCAERRFIPDTTQVYCCCLSDKYDMGRVVGQSHRRLLGRWWWSGAVGTMERCHPTHKIERKAFKWLHVVQGEREKVQATSSEKAMFLGCKLKLFWHDSNLKITTCSHYHRFVNVLLETCFSC